MADRRDMTPDDIAFGFGDTSQAASNQETLRHPLAVLFHLAFRGLALVAYLLCGWFSNSFIASFVTIIVLLSADFWTVKNITGRLLVGLRWWNYVDDEGASHWVYESRKETEQHLISPLESRIFWTALLLCPLLWIIFFFVTLFSLKFKWFMVVCIGIALNGANLHGYIKCKLGNKQTIGGAATSFFQQQVIKTVIPTSKPSAPSAPIHSI